MSAAPGSGTWGMREPLVREAGMTAGLETGTGVERAGSGCVPRVTTIVDSPPTLGTPMGPKGTLVGWLMKGPGRKWGRVGYPTGANVIADAPMPWYAFAIACFSADVVYVVGTFLVLINVPFPLPVFLPFLLR